MRFGVSYKWAVEAMHSLQYVTFITLCSIPSITTCTAIAILGYNDFEASKDNLRAIKIFFSKFPERAGNPFFLASESYGGHYIPQWTLQVLNDKDARKNFKGFLLGLNTFFMCVLLNLKRMCVA